MYGSDTYETVNSSVAAPPFLLGLAERAFGPDEVMNRLRKKIVSMNPPSRY